MLASVDIDLGGGGCIVLKRRPEFGSCHKYGLRYRKAGDSAAACSQRLLMGQVGRLMVQCVLPRRLCQRCMVCALNKEQSCCGSGTVPGESDTCRQNGDPSEVGQLSSWTVDPPVSR